MRWIPCPVCKLEFFAPPRLKRRQRALGLDDETLMLFILYAVGQGNEGVFRRIARVEHLAERSVRLHAETFTAVKVVTYVGLVVFDDEGKKIVEAPFDGGNAHGVCGNSINLAYTISWQGSPQQ